jgi:hypothetical protein
VIGLKVVSAGVEVVVVRAGIVLAAVVVVVGVVVGELDGDEVGEDGGGLEVGDEEGKDDIYEWDGVGGGNDDDNNGEVDVIVVIYGRVREVKGDVDADVEDVEENEDVDSGGSEEKDLFVVTEDLYDHEHSAEIPSKQRRKNMWVTIPPN